MVGTASGEAWVYGVVPQAPCADTGATEICGEDLHRLIQSHRPKIHFDQRPD